MRLCERCARTQQTCCEKASVRLTSGDVERIGRFTGLQDFYEAADTSKWEVDLADPLFSSVLVRDACRMLKRTERGCSFLSKCGCALPLEVRPLICRLYPMDYRESGLAGFVEAAHTYCPVPANAALLAELEMADEPQLRSWHRLLYQELRADYLKLCGEPWPATPPAPSPLRIQAA